MSAATSCRTCGRWGRPPIPRHLPRTFHRRYGFCFAKREARPNWALTLYPVGDTAKLLDRSPLLPDTDGVHCDAWKQTRRP